MTKTEVEVITFAEPRRRWSAERHHKAALPIATCGSSSPDPSGANAKPGAVVDV